ncbi:hypothetical protein DOTSEDRAFT_22062 [Dothistroma septosporum NZE10]|uniref:Uncharacterized protein n=1 Tax=Dothistroma septosporum (strain NZE10 / CBS 128990) TaxID=675120 RepID=N1PSM7_DOTSN|nr:hypothetical protein DOTSEDRAFT_22062 [Dothistroma septosporum NZE10]
MSATNIGQAHSAAPSVCTTENDPPQTQSQEQIGLSPNVPPFFRLPRELRDGIYNFAYGPDAPEVIKITSLLAKMDEAASNDLPKCPLSDMLVCRQFFLEVPATYFRMRTMKLCHLCMTVSDQIFDCFQGRLRFVHDFIDLDFTTISGVHDVPRLGKVELVSKATNKYTLAKTDEEIAQWHKNVAALQAFLKREIDRLWEDEKV